MQRNSQSLHPRRPPAHLSVCLYHDGPAIPSSQGNRPAGVGNTSSVVSPIRKPPDEGNNSEDSSGGGNWFDRSNMRPAVNIDQGFVDNEPPHFLHKRHSSNTSNIVSESNPHPHPSQDYGSSVPGIPHSATKCSSADDFRSVIDDLTIENRKLKERLRKYEASYNAHLEKDKLFEVKVHGLPARKKRELEETLRSFAASLDSSSESSAKLHPRDTRKPTFGPISKNTSLSSSLSRPGDSAYASMSNSGPTLTSTLNPVGADIVVHNQNAAKELNVQSFLHNIPEGLLPKHSSVMTERQKQKIVVRRLEQLFTGKKSSAVGEHSQPLQQQEVSRSAALADRAAGRVRPSVEGVREARILPYEMEINSKRPVKLADESSYEMDNSRGLSDDTADGSPDPASVEQRPTRPLDLDPDRAQVPSDNVEYIRHLGLSTPNFQNSGDVEHDGDGWIYLNLLINMAQLHIINVTPDFVRSAVADVSDKFQLSRDGRKIRWRGGNEGTRMSSDSGASSAYNRSPMDSDSLNESSRKRRKVSVGKFASVPIEISVKKGSLGTTQANPFYYKPLFHHRGSSSEDRISYSDGESPSGFGYGYEDASGSARVPRTPRLRSRGSHSMSGRKSHRQRRDNGPIIFYNNAHFCTDLSGDRCISPPLYDAAIGKDGYSNHTQDALGCESRKYPPNISRTPSGSLLPFRPFKDYSRGPDIFQTDEARARTPDLVVDDDSSDLDVSLEWSRRSAPPKPLINFSASGLGGTQPADHFAVQVETRRTKLDDHTQAKLSKFSAPGPSSKKFLHTIPKSALESFQRSERPDPDDIAAAIAALLTRTPSPTVRNTLGPEDLPVQTEIVSAKFARLEPSALPAPMAYYSALSSSDSYSDFSESSYSGISHLRGQKSQGPRSYRSASIHAATFACTQAPMEIAQVSGEMPDDEDDEDDNYDSDESIDMLAEARKADPKSIAEQEAEFEIQASPRLMDGLPTGSSAATVDGGSGASSVDSESSGDVEFY